METLPRHSSFLKNEMKSSHTRRFAASGKTWTLHEYAQAYGGKAVCVCTLYKERYSRARGFSRDVCPSKISNVGNVLMFVGSLALYSRSQLTKLIHHNKKVYRSIHPDGVEHTQTFPELIKSRSSFGFVLFSFLSSVIRMKYDGFHKIPSKEAAVFQDGRAIAYL